MEHAIGDQIADRYRVTAIVARGESAISYAAVELKSQRPVGIRHYCLDGGGAEAAAFEREAAVLSRQQHVNLPRYVEHFRCAAARGRGDAYLVHDASDARSLAEWAAQAPRREEEVRALAVQLLRVVDHLHRQQPPILHGRIAPEHVMRRDDGRLYLVGFAPLPGEVGMQREMIQADLRGIADTLVSVLQRRPRAQPWLHAGGLPGASREFRRWLQRLAGLVGEPGFASAAQAGHALPQAGKGNRLLVALAIAAVAAIGVTLAGGLFLMRWFHATLRASSAVASQRELGKPITDTRFVPKPDAAKPHLELEHVRSLVGHWSAVFDVRFDAAGETLASGSYDGSARLWNARDGAPLRTFAHEGKVGAVVFAGPGRVASGGDTRVRIWDRATGELRHALQGDARQVTTLASAGNGTLVVSGGFDGVVRVWNVESGQLVRELRQPPRVIGVAADVGGKRIASAGDDGVVRIHRLEDGALERELKAHKGPINELVFSSDGQTLISAGDDHKVNVWYVPAGSLLRTLEGHADEVWAIALDPTGKQLASGSKDGELRLWDVYTGKLELSWKADPKGVLALAYSPDGGMLAIGGGSQRVDLYKLRTIQPSWRPPPITAPVKRAPLKLPADASDDLKLVLQARALLDEAEGGRNLVEARALLERALAINPRSAAAHAELARVEYKAGFLSGQDYRPEALQRAHEQIKLATALDPNSYDAQLRLGYVFLFEKNYPRALEAGQRGERLRPGDTETQALFMAIASRQDQNEQIALHARAIIDSSQDPRQLSAAYGSLREVYENRGEWDAADEAYRSVINLDPESAWTKGNYANFLIRRKRYDEAIEWAQAAIAQMDYPMARLTLAEAHAHKARLALEAGDERGYQAALALAERSHARSPDVAYVRGLYHRRKGDGEAARRAFEAALSIDPEHRRAAEALKEIERGANR